MVKDIAHSIYIVCRMDILIVITPSIVALLSKRLRSWSRDQLEPVRTGWHPVEGNNLIE